MQGTPGWLSDFGSGHDLAGSLVQPRIGLCAESSDPGACFRFCVLLSLCPSPADALSLSKINKNFKTQETTSAGEDVEKKEPSCTVGRNANWCSHCGKQYGGFSKN